MPDIVKLVPVPGVVIPPGVLVTVQVPDGGNPLNTTLPVATLHEGCVIVPTTGAVGVAGCAFMTILPEVTEVHVEIPSVTV